MKKKLLIFIIIISGYRSYSQTNFFPASGNVGIGTTNPNATLEIVRTGINAGVEYPSLHISSSGSGNIYGPILYLNGTSGTGGRMWGMLSSGALDASATGAVGNFAIYDASAGSRLVINSSGYVGIGTINPLGKLHIAAGNIVVDTVNWYCSRNSSGLVAPIMGINKNTVYVGDLFGNLNNSLVFRANGSNQMVLSSSGNVSIGTNDPRGYKLAVNGSAIATSMTVELNANWPDYVFEKSYALPSISEVKSYIEQHQHLPDVPSKNEIIEKGQNLGEMNQLLLKKVEELTLYLIEKEKQLQEQNARVSQISLEFVELKKEIDVLKAKVK